MPEPPMPIADGSLVLFDYVLKVDGKVKETTLVDIAKEQGVLSPGKRYTPFLFTVGMGEIIPGLEKDIRMADPEKIGAPIHVQIGPEDAFGERQSHLVQTVPLAKFKGEVLHVGTQVQMDSQRGFVTRLGGGRVTVDCNHLLAGKSLDYEYTLRSVVTDPKQKVETRLRYALGDSVVFGWGKSNASPGTPTLTIEVPRHIVHTPQWSMERQRAVALLRRDFGQDLEITFIETFPMPPKPVVQAAETVPAEPSAAA